MFMQPCDWRHLTSSVAAVAFAPMPRRAAPPSPDPVESAQAAGLRYVSDATPGIRRKRAGKGFSYVGTDGKAVRDKDTLARIRSLAIPPAYTDVWICPLANGHV